MTSSSTLQTQNNTLIPENHYLTSKIKAFGKKLKNLNNKAMEIAEHSNFFQDDNKAYEVRIEKLTKENKMLREKIEELEEVNAGWRWGAR